MTELIYPYPVSELDGQNQTELIAQCELSNLFSWRILVVWIGCLDRYRIVTGDVTIQTTKSNNHKEKGVGFDLEI